MYLTCLLLSLLAVQPDRPGKPHIVFVTGDCEYRSEISMPLMAKILETHHGMKCTVLYATDEKGAINPKYLKNIKGLEALQTADLVVFFLRYRQLPNDQLREIVNYLDFVRPGRPVVGLRTSTHAFRYPSGPNARWNDGFGLNVLGQKWISHHGHDSSTRVIVTVKDHPITRGLSPEFWCRSWLYQVNPLQGDCTPLLLGQALKEPKADETIQKGVQKKQSFGTPNPVAWTKTYQGARVFFTTLGHPMDFEEENMRKLLINGIYWALNKEQEIPEKGCKADLVGEYKAPPTTMPLGDPLEKLLPERGIARK
jgi:type 1 glutamine amidotransferase